MGLFDKIKGLFATEKPGSQSPKSEFSESTSMNMGSDSNVKMEEDSMIDKAKDFVSGTVDEVKEQGSQLWDQMKEKASDLNEATKEYRERLAEKANETLEKIDDFVDSTVEKANKLKEEEKLKDANQDGLADKPIDFGKNLSESREDFFSKAEQWLEKNDSKDSHHENSSSGTNESNNHKVINPLELPKDPE